VKDGGSVGTDALTHANASKAVAVQAIFSRFELRSPGLLHRRGGFGPLASGGLVMNSIRVHPVVAGFVLAGVPVLALARGQQVQRLPVLTAEQAQILRHMSIVYLDDGQGGQTKTVRFTGVNVQVVNGLGGTSGNAMYTTDPTLVSTNGLGNVIIGYNEVRGFGDKRSGSHSLILGAYENYEGFGNIVSGMGNEVSGYGCICLASQYSVSAHQSSAVIASENCQLVGGAAGQNTFSAIMGSGDSQISGYTADYDVILGGRASTLDGAVGCALIAGEGNLASGANYASIIGGDANTMCGADFGVIAGGNSAYMQQATRAVIVGGESNQVLIGGDGATVLGGQGNQATGANSVVGGGLNRSALGIYDWVAGSLFEDQ
jgi:hypothetical protein